MQYTYIDEALRARWHPYRALEAEMGAFVPKPAQDFSAQREAELERFRVLNPDAPPDELAGFVDQQFQFRASPDWQFHQRFDQQHMSEYVTVVMLSHALCEAVINAVLAIGLANAGAVELFPLLEKADFKQKWLLGPKSFAPDYTFPLGGGLHETLGMLSQQRNALVHLKIELTVGSTRILEGSRFERKQYTDEQRWLRRYFSLPYDLSQFAAKSVKGAPIALLFDRRPIDQAPEHTGA